MIRFFVISRNVKDTPSPYYDKLIKKQKRAAIHCSFPKIIMYLNPIYG